jgi:transcriptional regulator with XRE-family HTH domain
MGKGCPIPQDMRQNILDDLDMGYSYAEIADRYGVSFSTIKRVKSRSPETPTAMENVPEDITADNNISTYSISEIPEAVKPELDYEEQKAYIADILKATLEDISEEVRSFEERIGMLKECLEERRQKQAYLRDFIRSME